MTSMEDIKKMNDKELAAFVEDKRGVVREARFGVANRNVQEVRVAKTEIARALTELTARNKAALAETTNNA